MFTALARMMDVPTALTMLGPRVKQMGRGGALLVFSCCLILIFPLGYLWWKFDLQSTWNWFDWIAAGAPADMEQLRAQAAANPETAEAAPDAETITSILWSLGVCFTLLPSAAQLGLARFVDVPGLGQLVKVSIAFDLVTDWPTMWKLAEANPWFGTTFRWGPLVWLTQAAATALGTIVVSLIVQTALILVFAVLCYMALVLIFGDGPRQPAKRVVEIVS